MTAPDNASSDKSPGSAPGSKGDPVAELVGPHTGLTLDSIVHAAEYRWDLDRGTQPPWAELDRDQRDERIRAQAADTLARFHTPPPPDPRPVDHEHVSSPPYPTGVDELGYWTRRVTDWIDEQRPWCDTHGVTLTGATSDPATLTISNNPDADAHNAFWRGQLAETIMLLEALHFRASLTPAVSGVDEVAHWITSQQARCDTLSDVISTAGGAGIGDDLRQHLHDDLTATFGDNDTSTDTSTDTGDRFRQGHVTTARMWLGFFRNRQRCRSMPESWKRGGRAVIDALNATDPTILAPTDDHPVPVALVVIAAHDDLTPPPAHAGLTAILRRHTGATAHECELAIRRAVDLELIRLTGSFSTPYGAYLTDEGLRTYRHLLDHLHDRTSRTTS